MPEGCIYRECRTCEWHIVRSGKLECNYANRLGISKPTVEAFAGGESEEVITKRRIEAKKKELETLKRILGEAEKVKGEAESGEA